MQASAVPGESARSKSVPGSRTRSAREGARHACCRPRSPARRGARARRAGSRRAGATARTPPRPACKSSGSITSCVDDVAVSTRSGFPHRGREIDGCTAARTVTAARDSSTNVRKRVSLRATQITVRTRGAISSHACGCRSSPSRHDHRRVDGRRVDAHLVRPAKEAAHAGRDRQRVAGGHRNRRALARS